ncbi:Exonuclease sbcC [Geobacillus sp. WSUCF1]|nr:Exonuclease sbcC [Geobacillus sp. WSUCF1]
MKPISLTIAGLHSFREKQTIDFTALCEGGVFGIFGPTGSGKSTILDAMTLALFGSVERAANRTQAIINHAEQELFVSFTFELENAAGAKRYTVERSLKKSGRMADAQRRLPPNRASVRAGRARR